MRALLIVLAVVCVTGCSSVHRVGSVSAKPNINLKKSGQSLALKLGPSVQDAFTAPAESGNGPYEVTAWTTSLTTAFAVAFEQAFTMAHDADLTLEVQEAELKPAAGNKAQIRYKAQLVDKTGKQVALTSGTAVSKATCGGNDCAPASAIETMYEELASVLFAEVK